MVAAWTKGSDRLAIGWPHLKRIAIFVDRDTFARDVVAAVTAAYTITLTRSCLRQISPRHPASDRGSAWAQRWYVRRVQVNSRSAANEACCKQTRTERQTPNLTHHYVPSLLLLFIWGLFGRKSSRSPDLEKKFLPIITQVARLRRHVYDSYI